MMASHLTKDDLRCKVTEDGSVTGEWRVEKMNEDGSCEKVQIFRGRDARQRAIDYARHHFGEFDEVTLRSYPAEASGGS